MFEVDQECLEGICNGSGQQWGALPPSNGSGQHWEMRLGVF